MSGLIGLWLANPADLELPLQTLLGQMPYRAPDGVATWQEGNVGLGLAYKRTLPEDALDAAIVTDGSTHIIADVRLDNRDELCTQLQVGANLTDTSILLAAFRRWGTAFTHHLLGDFAFIIFDQNKRLLVAGRDHMGVKPLFYRMDGDDLILSSEAKMLVAPGAPFGDLRLNGPLDEQVATFIRNSLPDDHIMLYAGVLRMPAGHVLIKEDGQSARLEKYWEPQAGLFPASHATPHTLRDLLEEAVRSRMRGLKPVACALSGGLDSSTIASLAARVNAESDDALPVDVFSVVFDKTPQHSERVYIDDVVRHAKLRPHYLHLDDYAPLADMEQLVKDQGRFVAAPGLQMTATLCANIKQSGFAAYLDGHGGDEVISHGFGRLLELSRARDWKRLWTNLGAWSGVYGRSRPWAFLMAYFKFSGVKGAYATGRLISRVAKRFTPNDETALSAEMQAKAFAPSIPPAQSMPTEALMHEAVLRAPYQTESLEILELTAAVNGMEVRFPFFDRRVVDFCLSVPAEGKLDGGWMRLILRQAMYGILPSRVQWRKDKFDFTYHVSRGLIAHHSNQIEALLDDATAPAKAYLNLPVVRASFLKLKHNPSRIRGAELQIVWRAVVLSLWLKQQPERQVNS